MYLLCRHLPPQWDHKPELKDCLFHLIYLHLLHFSFSPLLVCVFHEGSCVIYYSMLDKVGYTAIHLQLDVICTKK